MQLSEIYQNQAVKEFGEALGKAIGEEQDYASLTDLEFAQTERDFADALRRFLRRFHTLASKKENLWYCPSDSRLGELMQLVDAVAATVSGDDNVRYREAIRLVRAALISRALAQATYLRVQEAKQQQRATTQQSQS